MSPSRPPAWAERLLHRALGGGEAARAVLGDLHEDFVRLAAARGPRRARLWYWREALALAVGSWVKDVGDGRGRSARSGPAFFQDLRYALRSVRRDLAFSLSSAIIVGLGVGAATAAYGVTRPLLLRPLPFHEPERLVVIDNDAGEDMSAITSRTSNLRDFRERAGSFDGLAGFNAFFGQRSYNLVGDGEPERLMGVDVTHDLLDVLGVIPAVGRSFTYEEGLSDGPAAVMLTNGFWERRFGRDPAVVGSTLVLNGRPHLVVGVLPTSFDFSSVFAPATPVDVLRPWPVDEVTDRQGNTTTMLGRLRPGVSVEGAQAELDRILAELEREDPSRWGLGARTSGLQERVARPHRASLLLLAAGAGLVMLIVCANLSNMLLARGPRRKREMAVRRAFGATRGRLVRQLLLESLTVSAGGAALGAGIATLATRFVAGSSGLAIPMLQAVRVDGSALLFTVGVAVLAGLLAGVLPALQVAERGEAAALAEAGRGTGGGRAARRLREALVVSEVAMAVVLLVLGGLVLRSFRSVLSVDPGFEPDGAVAWQLRASRGFDTIEEMVAYYDEIVTAVEAVPGVERAGLVDALPLGRNRTWGARVVGETYEEGQQPGFFPHIVDHRYLDALGVPLLEGRGFTRQDTWDAPWVVMVSGTAARTLFPDGRALGRSLAMWYGEAEVVGVVGDVKHRALDLTTADSEVYFPMAQVWDFSTLDLVVRSRLPGDVVVVGVRAAIRSVDPGLPTEDFRTLASVVDGAVAPRRFTSQVLGAFAAAALLLAALGIYGVLSYSVAERAGEIGIRMALGESAADVRRSVVGRTLLLASVGIVMGVALSLLATRAVATLLHGVEPNDPATFATIVGVMMAVATLSGLVPAVRASRTDSADALRTAT